MKTIREVLEQDRDSLFELSQQFATSFTVERQAFDVSFSELLGAQDSKLMVAEISGKVVGYCLAFDHPAFFANGRVTWVEEIMVSPDTRRNGIGRQLMAAIERWAASRNSGMVALATRRASDFYGALGYSESATYFRKVLAGA